MTKEQSGNQYFGTFQDGHNFLSEVCGKCIDSKKCSIKDRLCHAMGENYPFWDENFVKYTDDSFSCKKFRGK